MTAIHETAERLEEVLDDVGQPAAADVPTDHPWSIEDPGAADWALRKLAKVNAELEQVRVLSAERIQAITDWRNAEQDRLTALQVHWESYLEAYHRKRLADDQEAKTIRLPNGTLTARKLPDHVNIDDPATLLDWCLEHEPARFVRVKEELDRRAIRDAVVNDGEVVPGVTPVTGEVRFSASTDVEGAS